MGSDARGSASWGCATWERAAWDWLRVEATYSLRADLLTLVGTLGRVPIGAGVASGRCPDFGWRLGSGEDLGAGVAGAGVAGVAGAGVAGAADSGRAGRGLPGSTGGGTIEPLMLPGSRRIHLSLPMVVVLRWVLWRPEASVCIDQHNKTQLSSQLWL